MPRVKLMPYFSRLFAARRVLAFAAVVGSTSACYVGGNTGLPPPSAQVYFPTGLAVSPGRTALYVANSDFDLQFNGGTVQVFDLATLRATLNELRDNLASGQPPSVACTTSTISLQPTSLPLYTPSPCMPIPVGSTAAPIVHTATIGAFASTMILASDTAFPGDPNAALSRLFVPVRGDPSITWFNIADDRVSPPVSPCTNGDAFCLDCGQAGDGSRCADSHRMGLSPFDNTRYLTLPVEPIGIAASDDGRTLITAHQTQSAVGASENSWGHDNLDNTWTLPSDPSTCQANPVAAACGTPTFQFELGGLAAGPTGVASVPAPALAQLPETTFASGTFNYQPGFLVTYNQAAQVDLVRYYADDGSSPRRPYLALAASTPLTVNGSGRDSRGLAIDCSARRTFEQACPSGSVACLSTALRIPCGVFIANRSPASVILGHLRTTVTTTSCGGEAGDACQNLAGAADNSLCCSGTCDSAAKTCVGGSRISGAFDALEIYDRIPLSLGPSVVARGDIIDLDGKKQSRIFVTTFDTKWVYMIDPATPDADPLPIETGPGPQALAFDTGDDYSYLFVGHFTDSYLGVVDLDMRHLNTTFATMFAAIGTPTKPIEAH